MARPSSSSLSTLLRRFGSRGPHNRKTGGRLWKFAGAALGVFSAGLLAMYFRNPSMTESDGIRPSQEGMSLAKDAFMAAIAGALVVDNS